MAKFKPVQVDTFDDTDEFGRGRGLEPPGHELNVIMGLDADGKGPWPAARRAAELADQEESE